MISITQVRISPDDSLEKAEELAINKVGLKKSEIQNIHLTKTSVDGRHGKVQLIFSYTIEAFGDEKKIVERADSKDVVYKKAPTPYKIEKVKCSRGGRPVIVGFGPAGMMCGLVLARAGLRPIIIEQGSSVEKRAQQVEEFWKTGKLNASSNVQFGEGGAGTFSDGKLTTRIGDTRCSFVLNTFFEFGAPEEILYQAKPHIGTDQLRTVVKNLREEILHLGGEIHFETEVKEIQKTHGKITGVSTGTNQISTSNIVLAIGHSARSMFSYLLENDVKLEKKAFSVGVRIEHLQESIDQSLYGKYAGHPALPHAEYQLSHRDKEGRGVYTFCMCPGGYVVASASEESGVVTNGMSEYARDAKNANSGLVVSISPEDTEGDILSGVAFQRMLEKKAFSLGGRNYRAPMQTVGAYLGKKESSIANITPTYEPGVESADLHELFPAFVNRRLEDGIQIFDRKLKGFADSGAILTGVESRTSSPVRVLRGENFQALGIEGLFPCGEGAGYAGGIMSAAVDGLKVAEAIIGQYCNRF